MIWLNNAATSYPKPPEVLAAVLASLAQPPPDAQRHGGDGADPAGLCRERLVRLLGAPDPRRVLLCSGATEAANLAIFGLLGALPGGAADVHAVATEVEHNAVLRPLYRLRDGGQLALTIVPCREPGRIAAEDVVAALRPETRLVALNAASNVTGREQPVAAVHAACAVRGVPLLVDLAQAAGALPVDLAAWPGAIAVFTGHKGLLGPAGTGGLVVGPAVDLAVWKTGGTGADSDAAAMPAAWPQRFEPGTPNHPGLAGLAAALEVVLARGVGALGAARAARAAELAGGLARLRGVRVWAAEPRNPAGVVSFTLAGFAPEDLAFVLRESFGIVVRAGLHCAPLVARSLGAAPLGTVRASVSAATTAEEVGALVAAVAQLARG